MVQRPPLSSDRHHEPLRVRGAVRMATFVVRECRLTVHKCPPPRRARLTIVAACRSALLVCATERSLTWASVRECPPEAPGCEN
jgi:hypothetical protein